MVCFVVSLCFAVAWECEAMGDTELELSPTQLEELQKSPSASSTSSTSSLSLPSSPSSGPHPLTSSSPSTSEGLPTSSPPLDVITEGVGELSLVIDTEVAKKACHEVLQKVKFLKTDGEVPSASSEPVLVNGTAHPESTDGGKPPKISVDEAEPVKNVRRRQKNNSSKQSWLLRLFESKLFDISMAISYLYNSKEPGVQAYIGNRLFSFRNEDVDFYLPQLLNMYIHMDEDVGDAIKPYVVHRCRQSINFSLQCAWLLGAYSSDMHISTQRHSRGTKLRKLILSDELKPSSQRIRREVPQPPLFCPPPLHHGQVMSEHSLSPSKRTHQRSKSDATISISLSSNLKRTASNPKVESSQDEVRHPLRHMLAYLVSYMYAAFRWPVSGRRFHLPQMLLLSCFMQMQKANNSDLCVSMAALEKACRCSTWCGADTQTSSVK